MLADLADCRGGRGGASSPSPALCHVRSRDDRFFGRSAGRAEAIAAMKSRLFPLVDCLTPNLAEAGALLGRARSPRDEAEMIAQGRALLEARSARRFDEGRPSRIGGGRRTFSSRRRGCDATPARASLRATCTARAARFRRRSPPISSEAGRLGEAVAEAKVFVVERDRGRARLDLGIGRRARCCRRPRAPEVVVENLAFRRCFARAAFVRVAT